MNLRPSRMPPVCAGGDVPERCCILSPLAPKPVSHSALLPLEYHAGRPGSRSSRVVGEPRPLGGTSASQTRLVGMQLQGQEQTEEGAGIVPTTSTGSCQGPPAACIRMGLPAPAGQHPGAWSPGCRALEGRPGQCSGQVASVSLGRAGACTALTAPVGLPSGWGAVAGSP